MAKPVSAGLLMYSNGDVLRVLLAHPGGPFFARKDEGSWSIPKGLVDAGEELLNTAKREFNEETGYDLREVNDYLPLESVTLSSGKIVHAWAFAGEWEDGRVPDSNLFSLEWPRNSGNWQKYPEIDRAEMFTIEVAAQKINPRQRPFLARLQAVMG